MEKESKTHSEKKLWGDYDTEEEEDDRQQKQKQKAEEKIKKNEKSNKKDNKNDANYKIIDDAAEQG